MTPRARSASWLLRAVLYLVLAHATLGALLLVAFRGRPAWMLVTEVTVAVSLLAGIQLLRRASVAQDLLRTGVELLRERDFGSHLLPVGQPDADALAELFNHLSDHLREERLRLEEQNFLLDKVLAASPMGVLTLDHDGRVALLNGAAAQMLGGRAQAGQPLAELPGPLARELVALVAGESRLVPVEGRRRLKCYRGQFFDRGFPRSFFLMEEVTEELRTSEKAAYEQLVRMISHEVGNSVAAVASLLESCLAWGEQLPPDEREEFEQALTVAQMRMRSLNAFVNGFAEVVRLPPPDRRPTDLGALVEELRLLLSPEMERRRITCRWSPREPLPPLSLDRHQMEQVVVNVFRNAIESIGKDGEIVLSLAREDGRPTLRVADSGKGIAREAESPAISSGEGRETAP